MDWTEQSMIRRINNLVTSPVPAALNRPPTASPNSYKTSPVLTPGERLQELLRVRRFSSARVSSETGIPQETMAVLMNASQSFRNDYAMRLASYFDIDPNLFESSHEEHQAQNNSETI